MIKPEQIPEEAVEAAAREIAMAHGVSETAWKAWTLDGRAALAAALAAWPKRTNWYATPAIILPLQETQNGL
jgi:hypothetical protein